MLVLDLRFNGNLDSEISTLFNDIANRLRRSFTELVSELSKPLRSNLDWWVSGPASRNTLVSPFFHHYCALHLVDHLVKEKYQVAEILVDSVAFHKVLGEYLQEVGYNVTIRGPKYSFLDCLVNVAKRLRHVISEFDRKIYQYKCARRTLHLQQSIPPKPLTLIDVYVFPGFISKDRYYNGLWENLSSDQKASTFFIPTLVMFSREDILPAYEELRSAERNFLIKEDFLTIRDVLFAISHSYRILRVKIKSTAVLGVDISPLIEEELESLRGLPDAVEALLNYCFAQRISEHRIKLRLVIDWFENQVVDKGWNAGFNKFYPEVPSIGCRGLVPAHLYLSQCSPSTMELDSNVLPSRMAVTGRGFIDSIKEFAPNLKATIVPAFRFQHLWDGNASEPDSPYFTILVALSVVPDESFGILVMIKESMKSIDLSNTRFWIKPHPTMSEEAVRRGLGETWPKEFVIVEGNASDYICRSNILISGMSSICLETLALGIPVIVIENPSRLNYNPIPQQVSQGLWRSCRTSIEVAEAIQSYKNRSPEEFRKYKEMGEQIRQDYFEPVTRDAVLNFLDLKE